MNGIEKGSEEAKKGRWLGLGFLISLVLSVALYGLVILVKNNYVQVKENVIESEDNIDWLFRNNRVLYKELYQKVNGTVTSYGELFLKEKDNSYKFDPDLYHGMEEADYRRERNAQIEGSKMDLEETLRNQAASFNVSGQLYDYGIRDLGKGTIHSNLPDGEMPQIKNYSFYISFLYDKDGNVALGDWMAGSNVDNIRRYANMAIRNQEEDYEYLVPKAPVNCEIVYAMRADMIDKIAAGNTEFTDTRYTPDWDASFYHIYRGEIFLLWGAFLAIPFLLAFLLPGRSIGKGYEESRACRISLEFMGVWGLVFLAAVQASLVFSAYTASGVLSDLIRRYTGVPRLVSGSIAASCSMALLTLIGLLSWYLGICFRPVRELGVWQYCKQRCLVLRYFSYLKRCGKKIYTSFVQMNLEKELNEKLLVVTAANFLVLSLGSILFGVWNELVVFMIFLYSVGVFFLVRKYMKDLQHKYGILMNAVDQMAQGNLNADMEEDMGILEPLRPKLVQIQNGFRQAVEEEVKSQKMKAELITNVSHDLKTPLTAIITYIGLLREKDVTEAQREEYMNTLENKSLRLKMLIEDLFEVSKANSGNISLNLMDVDLVNLVKQAHAEAQRMLEDKGLDVRLRLPVKGQTFPLDSQKAYRIYENLFHNVAKYALKGTRVYVDGGIKDDWFYISIKNISEQELTLTGEELADRFVRGDVSRNTEGSGLGLAIARSFTQLMGGRFEIDADGDLFKVTTWWPVNP